MFNEEVSQTTPDPETPTQDVPDDQFDLVRLFVWFHVVAIVICEIATLSDRSLFFKKQLSEAAYEITHLLATFLLIALFICPLAVLLETVWYRKQCFGIYAEVLLIPTHLFVLLPSVQ